MSTWQMIERLADVADIPQQWTIFLASQFDHGLDGKPGLSSFAMRQKAISRKVQLVSKLAQNLTGSCTGPSSVKHTHDHNGAEVVNG